MIRQKSELTKISTYISFIYSALYHLKRTSFNKIIVNCSRCRLQLDLDCFNFFTTQDTSENCNVFEIILDSILWHV